MAWARKDGLVFFGVLLSIAVVFEWMHVGRNLENLDVVRVVAVRDPASGSRWTVDDVTGSSDDESSALPEVFEEGDPAAASFEFGEPRGWHPERRRRDFSVRLGAEASEQRLQGHPFETPAVQDPGAVYLPFREEHILPDFRNVSRLVYDASVIRLTDDFGLIDDMYQPEEMVEFFQLVVDIYARGNIYLRISREDLLNTFHLSRKQSLEYLAYVEGPDLAEMNSFKHGTPPGMGAETQKYNAWYEREFRKEYPFPVIEAAVKRSSGLKKLGYSTDKYNFMRNFIDWIIGYPHLLTPWDLYHTTPMFPIYVFHGMNGECRGGRITGRAGSCWLPPKKIFDKTTGDFVKNMTCRRFAGGLKTRFNMRKGEVYIRNSEMRTMLGPGAARMWAHEIGHSLGQHHPGSSCNLADRWEDNNLMLQQRHVGKKGEGCPKTPEENQARGTRWTSKQLQKIRGFIRVRDVRQSPTLPGAVTVGGSTMQMGARSEPVFQRMVFNRAQMIGSGKNIRRKECELPQATLVFTRLPSPVAGRVYRLRWLPSHWRPDDVEVVVSVVAPAADQDVGAEGPEAVNFEIVKRSRPLVLRALKQHMHVELDLDEPLEIQAGQFISVSTMDGSPLNIDQQLYASDKVLYGDISGRLPANGPSFHNEVMSYSVVKTAYPKVLLSHRARDHFFYSKSTPDLADLAFRARKAPESKDEWCLPLIFNYDVVAAAL